MGNFITVAAPHSNGEWARHPEGFWFTCECGWMSNPIQSMSRIHDVLEQWKVHQMRMKLLRVSEAAITDVTRT